MSISATCGARGLQRLVCLKSNNVQKWEIRFTLEFNAAKNMHYIKNSFKYTDPWSPTAPLVREIDICARGLFCAKFNSEQPLFKHFSNVMRIFGSVEHQSESNLPFLYIIRF